MDLPALRRFLCAVRLSFREGQYAWFFKLRHWQKKVREESVSFLGSSDVTAVILSYKRPQNIDPILRSLLKSPSIRRIVLSNNNPAIRMRDWVSVQDPRLKIIEQMTRQHTPIRFAIAEKEEGDLFLSIDDDIFLLPSQIEMLCSALRADPSVPHGIFGQVYDPASKKMRHAVHGVTQLSDVINRVYAYTKKHLEAFERVRQAIGMREAHPLYESSLWDDLVLSFSGMGKPLISDVGSFLDCPTIAEKGIAVMTEPDFFTARERLFVEFNRLRSSGGA